jgi:glutamine cyclotransferase
VLPLVCAPRRGRSAECWHTPDVPHTVRRTLAALAALASLVIVGCGHDTASPAGTAATAAGPEALRVEVIATTPHDTSAFTEGLELDGSTLIESTGLYGRSELRRVDRATGTVVSRRSLDPTDFGEGTTRVGDRLVQLTWKEHTALVWDAATLEPRGSYTYAGEGWGLCSDGSRLVMSNGSDVLTFRDPTTFAETGRVTVRDRGRSIDQLNELECVDGSVYANVWQTDRIVRIDPGSGAVTANIDATGLLRVDQTAGVDVLNGIAHDPTTGHFLLTGKLWPTVFEVRFVAA